MIARLSLLVRTIIICRVWPNGGTMRSVGNRFIRSSFEFVPPDGRFRMEFTRTTFIPDEPTVYSREEVFSMLKIVREQERRMGWTCPEPPP